jgi:serine phosphatase RsbU (regulator of sigma subunit)
MIAREDRNLTYDSETSVQSMPVESQQRSSNHRATVLIVDDEDIVLTSLRTLLQLDTDYKVLTYLSPVEALQAIQKQPVDAVISDFLMPELSGLQFLSEVKKLYPTAPRILLTGYADKGNAINAINDVGLFQYIEKPWENEHIKMVLRNGLQNKALEERLQQKIKELDETARGLDVLANREGILRHELSLAQQVQRNLLPKSFPRVDGYRFAATFLPALEIGGDFYDFQTLSDGRIGILVADATGHGIQAALSTALLKFAFATTIDSGKPLVEIAAAMSEILLKGLPENIFVAGLVAILDTARRKVQIVNAGLPHPLLLRPGACCLERVPVNGLFLGIDLPGASVPGETAEINLAKGDRLVLYTDGVSEAAGADGLQFDDGAMADHLEDALKITVDEMVNRLAESAIGFRDERQEPDDITIVAIEAV